MEYGSYSPVFSQVKTTGAGELEPEVTAISEDSAGRLSLLLTLLIAREVVGCNGRELGGSFGFCDSAS